ncbi:MAG: hypothetical protein BWY57_02384 [Betaproteobacteria bacterium ADurb.Bin341]|nr:MAG: hypothetical protein BWY57_02384 [Betaproteobacteria bacterium ADurb.Bin341]
MFSFALQHASWPDDVFAFRLWNLGIHLLNGVLLYFLAWCLAGLRGLAPKSRQVAAFAASALWLLHPMQVSTVLYVVQRMTQLSATFSLVALLIYLWGRQLAMEKPGRGYAVMTLGLIGAGLLAALSKENGALLPLFILVLEATLLRGLPSPCRFGLWKTIVLWLPLAGAGGYFAAQYATMIQPGYALRDFSPAEHLLTEARALSDYLALLVLPRAGSFGLFHDDYAVSRGLLLPPHTLLAVVVVAGLLLAALLWVRRFPLFSFAQLWFFCGHLLESSIIPLESYFEHRNYFPSVGLAIAAGLVLEGVALRWGHQRKWLLAGGAVWLLLFGMMTWNECRLWGNPALQARVWARQHPDSERAQLQFAKAQLVAGDGAGAASTYRRMAAKHPGVYAVWASAFCLGLESMEPIPFEQARSALSQAVFSKTAFGGLEAVVRAKENKSCAAVPAQQTLALFDALLANRNYKSQFFHLQVLKGRLLAVEGEPLAAVACFERAQQLRPQVDLALLAVKTLAESGLLGEARDYLQRARALNDSSGNMARYHFAEQIRAWEAALNGKAAANLRTR